MRTARYRCTHCDTAFTSEKAQDPDLDTGYGCCDRCWSDERARGRWRGRRHWMIHGDCGGTCAPGCCRLRTAEAVDAYRAKHA